MENENIIVEEVFEEFETAGPSKGVKIAAGIGIAALLGTLAYKFVVKPVVAKIKAKKEQCASEPVYLESNVVEPDED